MHIKKRHLPIFIVMILVTLVPIFGSLSLHMKIPSTIRTSSLRPILAKSSGPLYFNGDPDLDTYFAGNASMDGLSWETAYRLENLTITATNKDGIFMADTSRYVIIRNVSIETINSYNAIEITDVAHVRIQNCSLTGNNGFYGYQSIDVSITETYFHESQNNVLFCQNMDNLNVSSNEILSTPNSVSFHTTANLSIQNNHFSFEDEGSLYLDSITNATILGNNFTNGGIDLRGSNDNLTISQSNLVNGDPIEYYEDSTGLELTPTNIAQILWVNVSNSHIVNFERTDAFCPLSALDCKNITFEALNFTYSRYMALRVYDSQNFTLQESWFDNSPIYQAVIRATNEVQLINNTFRNAVADGLYLRSVTDITMENNTFENAGLYTLSLSNLDAHNNQFIDSELNILRISNINFPTSNTLNGDPIYYFMYENNRSIDIADAGLVIVRESNHMIFSDGILDESVNWIYIDDSSYLEFRDFYMVNFSQTAVQISESHHIRFLNSTFGPGDDNAIEITYSSDINITRCLFQNLTNDVAVQVDEEAANLTISENWFYNCSEGIEIWSTANASITDNFYGGITGDFFTNDTESSFTEENNVEAPYDPNAFPPFEYTDDFLQLPSSPDSPDDTSTTTTQIPEGTMTTSDTPNPSSDGLPLWGWVIIIASSVILVGGVVILLKNHDKEEESS